MEIPKLLQHRLQFLGLRQNGRAEVECAWFLTEAAAGNNTDAGVLQQLESVEDVRRLVGLFRCLDRFGGYRDLGEGVHRSLDRVAAETLEAVEGVCDHFGSELKQTN